MLRNKYTKKVNRGQRESYSLDISDVDPYHFLEAKLLQLVLKFTEHKENRMKPANIPIKNDPAARKMALKRARTFDKQVSGKEINQRRLRIVRSTTAGHVRGGHSFH